MQFNRFKALSFDCYGTLIDWETGIIDGLKPLTSQLNGKVARDRVLEIHAFYESRQQLETPSMKYSEILAVVYRRMSEEWRIRVLPEDCSKYGQSVKNWPAFPDSANALRYLKKHFRLYILSNVDVCSFAISNEKLGVNFDGVYTAEDVGAYKPSDRNFEYMLLNLSRQGIEKSEILHVAESLFHDHTPANRYDLANCRIFRRKNKDGLGAAAGGGAREMPRFDVSFDSMSELVESHKGQFGTLESY